MTPEDAFDGARRRTVEAPSSERPTAAAPLNFNTLAAAVEQVESGGREDAVSPKGAVGPMQTMPTTLTDPGFGVRPAQNDSPEEMRRVGQDYLAAMLRKYNGNLDHALAAYNWGPGNADKWIAEGADPSKLPKETREYIPKVKTAMGARGEATVRTVTSMPTSQRDNVEMAESYLANPDSIPFEMQQLNQLAQQQYQMMVQQRNENARLAQIMMQSGTSLGIENAMQMRDAVNQQDLEIVQFQNQIAQKQMYLQGMQGLREFATANDPRRLSGVLSEFMGVPVAIQPRADGTYNYFVNGRRVQEGVSAAQVASTALREFSPEARQAAAASAALENELALKQQYGDAVVNAMKAIQVAIINGEYGVAKEHAKKQGLEVRPDTSTGTWAVIRNGQELYMIDPTDVTREKTKQGVVVTTTPPARQITGLNFTGR
jgi:Fe-S cluster assembly iron-binding protein IscA